MAMSSKAWESIAKELKSTYLQVEYQIAEGATVGEMQNALDIARWMNWCIRDASENAKLAKLQEESGQDLPLKQRSFCAIPQ